MIAENFPLFTAVTFMDFHCVADQIYGEDIAWNEPGLLKLELRASLEPSRINLLLFLY